MAAATEDGGGAATDAVCRICMEAGAHLDSLFGDADDKWRKVMSCASVSVAKDDGMPDALCARCAQDLDVAFDFKARCERSDAILRDRLGIKPTTVVKTEIVLLDCDDELNMDDEDNDKEGRKTRSKKRLDDDFVHDEDTAPPTPTPSTEEDDDDDEERQHSSRRRRRKRKRRHRHQKSEDDITSMDDEPKRPKNKYPCPHCDRSFPYPSVLKLHLVTHTKPKNYKCQRCPETFSYPKGLYAHFSEAHPFDSMEPLPPQDDDSAPKTFACPTCDRVFSQSKNLKVHEAMHAREKKYKCDMCDASYTNMTILSNHKKTEHPDAHKRIACDKCSKTFKKREALDRHVEASHRKKPPPAPQPSQPKSSANGDYKQRVQPAKDLFKSIAPITTTYWSDSFSD